MDLARNGYSKKGGSLGLVADNLSIKYAAIYLYFIFSLTKYWKSENKEWARDQNPAAHLFQWADRCFLTNSEFSLPQLFQLLQRS